MAGFNNKPVSIELDGTEYDDIRELLPHAILEKCWIPQHLKDVDCTFDFVHIDLDLYEPILGALEYFVDKTRSGCIIIVDDYNDRWKGCGRY